MLGLKLNHVSKRGPRCQAIIGTNDGLVFWGIYASLELISYMIHLYLLYFVPILAGVRDISTQRSNGDVQALAKD